MPSTTEYAHQTIVSGGKVYVLTGNGPNEPSNVWLTDASTPGTPSEVKTNGIDGCVMNGQLFWTAQNQGVNAIFSCAIGNCSSTTTPVVSLISGQFFGMQPGCDPVNSEIVWASTSDNATFTIGRASSNGSNARTITSLYLVDNTWHFVGNGSFPGETDRIFYRRGDLTSGTDWLYYISTKVLNATGIQVAKVQNVVLSPPIASPLELANDSVFLADEYFGSSPTFSILSVPLPNGTVSGTPPTFTGGYIYEGTLDQTSFYGAIRSNSSIPEDAVVECPLTDCSAPTILARGQTAANFANDLTAVYWTTSGQASNVAIWKVAK